MALDFNAASLTPLTDDHNRALEYLTSGWSCPRRPCSSYTTIRGTIRIRGVTTTAMSLEVPHTDFTKHTQMSDARFEKVRAQMRGKYATPLPSKVPDEAKADW